MHIARGAGGIYSGRRQQSTKASRADDKNTINAYLTTITKKDFKHNNIQYALDNVNNARNGSVESKFKLEIGQNIAKQNVCHGKLIFLLLNDFFNEEGTAPVLTVQNALPCSYH